jgi:2-dehydropantoate 2-reductase
MKFAIVGAGAMGCLVGAMLAKAGAEVWLVNRNEAITGAIRRDGLKVTLQGEDEWVPIRAVQSPAEIGATMDVILFLVKGCHTEAAAAAARCLADEHTYVMTLQNGIGNVEILAQFFARERILYGLLEFAGKMIEPGHVQGFIGANSKICFGPATKVVTEEMERIAAYFKPGIKVILRPDIDSEVWIKLRNNSANVLFGFLRLSIGQALAAEGAAELIQGVRAEVIAVARAKGIQFTPEELQVNGGKTPVNPELYAHIPSTALDMKNKKPTEVEFLNGAVYREGLRVGVPTPYNELLYKMVKIYENTYELQF